ncbi:MAG: archease [Nitrososphaerales archaeon]|jgi:SHS2 domain-containing protein
MPFRFLPDIALADIAFEATSDSVNGLFESSALALSDIMVDPETLRSGTIRKVRVSSEDLDRLLYDFLTEIIVVKDVDSLLFREVEVKVAADQKSLEATMKGEPIDRDRHLLRNDVKAVTMHMFGVKREGGRWKATVVLDI